MTESALKSAFLDRVSGYLDGRMDWESVHEASIRLLIENADKFESQPALEELHQIFLADSNDDPQFRESDEEIRRLFALAEKEGPRKLISN